MIKPLTAREAERMILLARIREIHEASGGAYGSPRVFETLRDAGVKVARRTVEAVMRDAKLQGAYHRKRKSTPIDYPPNLLLVHEQRGDREFWRRCFDVRELDRVWVADITYFPTCEGFLYLALILDLCSRRALGWGMGCVIDARLALSALDMAMQARRPAHGLIHHSDRGSQYIANDYRDALAGYGATQSMSRTATCRDNAVMEANFGAFKRESGTHPSMTREQVRAALERFLAFYNATRKHTSLGNLSPSQFEATRRKL